MIQDMTPAPWSAVIDDDGREINIGHVASDQAACHIEAVPDEEGCIDNFTFTKEMLANAAAISALPELLAALNKAVRCLEYEQSCRPTSQRAESVGEWEAITEARAALAKANRSGPDLFKVDLGRGQWRLAKES